MEATDSMIENQRREAKERRKNLVHESNKCFKCKGVPHLKYRNGLVVCKVCFKGAVVETHFRSLLRGFLNPKPSNMGKVLLLLSGGPSSTALALMTGETVNGKSESKRKMFVEAEMLFVDESIFYPEDKDLWDLNYQRLRKLEERVGLKLHITSIEEQLKIDRSTAASLLDSCSDRGSCREDVITIMRQSVISGVAHKLGFTKALLGDNALRVASNTLATMVKGKGLWFEAVSKEISEFVPGESDLLVCRPLREFSPKEVYFYLHSNGLAEFTISRPHLTSFVAPKVSTLPGKGNYTLVLDTFLEMLQKDFSSSIFTVLKTSDRTRVSGLRSDDHCSICHGTIEADELGDRCYGCKGLVETMKDDTCLKKLLEIIPGNHSLN